MSIDIRLSVRNNIELFVLGPCVAVTVSGRILTATTTVLGA